MTNKYDSSKGAAYDINLLNAYLLYSLTFMGPGKLCQVSAWSVLAV
jgi:hypothetical protein